MRRKTLDDPPWEVGSETRAGLIFGDEFAGVEDLTVATSGGTPVAVPFDAPRTALTSIVAAGIATQLGLRSVDYVRRKYVEPYHPGSIEFPESYLYLLEASAEIKTSARKAAHGYYNIRNKPDHPGLFGAGCALLRLFVSFRAAVYALRNGMHFEFGVVGRLILEQIAWAYAVHRVSDVTMFAMNPQSQISKLKEILPNAGRLYGRLSDQAHIPPALSVRYLDFRIPGDPGLHCAMYHFGGNDLVSLAQLADAYCACFDVLAASMNRESDSVRIAADSTIKLSSRRASLRLARRIEKDVHRLAESSSKP